MQVDSLIIRYDLISINTSTKILDSKINNIPDEHGERPELNELITNWFHVQLALHMIHTTLGKDLTIRKSKNVKTDSGLYSQEYTNEILGYNHSENI